MELPPIPTASPQWIQIELISVALEERICVISDVSVYVCSV